MKNSLILLFFVGVFLALFFVGGVNASILINHTAVAKFDQYKDDSDFQNFIGDAKSMFHIGYGHTSHGSQITSGMSGFNNFMNNLGYSENLFAWNNGGSGGALDLEEGAGYGEGWLDHDCGYVGWDDETRYYLDGSDPGAGTADHSDVNIILWSWCGQVNDVNIQTHYLDNMADLENEYPDVTFIYMTGHLEGYKTGDSWFNNNNAIRDWVAGGSNRVLFDFADIEKYDPEQLVNYADYFADDNCDYDSDGTSPRNEDSNWATEWQNSHIEGVDWYSVSCAHSQSLNCNQKAKAFWYMMAMLAGWDDGSGSDSTTCDDSVCDLGECGTCPSDCDLSDCCGDGTCQSDVGENCANCPTDCPTGSNQVCCSGVLYTGDCCDNSDCVSPETCVSYICTLASTCSPADSDKDGSVSITELINYIADWKLGDVTITELIAGIGEWKSGC